MSKTPAYLPSRESDPYLQGRVPFPSINLRSPKTGLLLVDMQNGCLHPEHEYYSARLRDTTLPALRALLSAFRRVGFPVFHTHIQSLTHNGDDRSTIHKTLECHYPPGSDKAEFLKEVAPLVGEPIFPKTASSVFNSTNIDRVLRNIGIENLVIGGVVTTGCVETAVRDAADLGYRVVMPEDACAAIVEDMHWATVRAVRDVYAEVSSSEDVVKRLGEAASR